jgi:predicted ATP-grasp superfamily ATP-dependent carboligase
MIRTINSKESALAARLVYLMDCEQRCAEGVVYSLASHGYRVVGLTPSTMFAMRFSRHLESWCHSPALSDGFEQYFSFLRALPGKGVIVPSGDLSVKFLSQYATELESEGFLLNVPEKRSLETLFDKYSCNRACINMQIPVARTFSPADIEQDRGIIDSLRWPVVVKPTALAGGNYRKVETSKGLASAIADMKRTVGKDAFRLNESGVLVQEWIDSGMEDNWSCEVFYDKAGQLIDFVTIKRIRTSLNEQGTPTSRMYCGVLEPEKKLVERTHKLLSAYGWRGFAHVEYIYSRKDDEFYLTEVNPRLPGYAYLLSASGHEHGWYYAADLMGEVFHVNGKCRDVMYFETLRYPGDVTDGVVNALRGNLGFGSLIKSYADAVKSRDQVVVDYFNVRDLGQTLGLILVNIKFFIDKSVSYIKRRLRKHEIVRKV